MFCDQEEEREMPQWLGGRLKEGSSWAGVGALLFAVAGLVAMPPIPQTILIAGGVICVALAFGLKDKLGL